MLHHSSRAVASTAHARWRCVCRKPNLMPSFCQQCSMRRTDKMGNGERRVNGKYPKRLSGAFPTHAEVVPSPLRPPLQ